MAVKPIPEGYHTVTPYLTVADAEAQIDFLKRAFGAEETYRHSDDKGRVGHAEDASRQLDDHDRAGPRAMDTEAGQLLPVCRGRDAVYKRAVAAGGKSLREPTNEAYGDRSSGVEDSQGNQWWIGTHVEDVSPEEIQRRYSELAKKQARRRRRSRNEVSRFYTGESDRSRRSDNLRTASQF